MPKGQAFSGEFKQRMVENMRTNKLSFRETARKYNLPSHERIRQWKQTYLMEGAAGLYVYRCGRKSTEQPVKLPKQVKEDLLAGNQRLQMEINYLKKLNALVSKEEQQSRRQNRTNTAKLKNKSQQFIMKTKVGMAIVALRMSYTIYDHPVLNMVTNMVEKAFSQIPNGTNLVLHSDQNWHYQHKRYQRMLREKGIRQRMSRKGNCLDNAVIESFFEILKRELLYLQGFEFLKQFKAELIDYLDYYNNRHIKAKLKVLAPAMHRQQALLAT